MHSRLTWLLLTFGYLFLYVPIIILVIYSFNESRLVTVWSGFSTQWYRALWEDQQLLAAVWMSLRIAFLTATAAVGLGTAAAMMITRFGHFPGYTPFAAMITAPLVMPEVITGISLLLLFVALEQAIGFPQGRGMLTIWIAHVTFCTAYVTVVISSRLRELDPALEEAAMDLGATPWKVFFLITLPIIAPALLSGWLLAFTLSLDDLVVASFVSGPGSTTLPMVVYSSVRLGVSPKINALASIIILVMFLGVFIAGWIMLRMERKRDLEMQQVVTETLEAEAALFDRPPAHVRLEAKP
ncbi:ABC transporter permease subunit [Thioflexithrix psekupsensis]|uniref:Putrescine ABC transporter permease PotI n=1 Tax=Thioflexithrix psekupsensis TaxID=1570016 RepID=A0A251X8F3_9GAMM|nr:ABC transporter permease subunit [Thioflexithrix psekupsensis]OUD14007.1 putrescine ABC transporter permease PotI [Thioflexithrix psekupsensis]